MTKIQFNKHWGSWASGYLKLAEQGFLFLKNQSNIGRIRYSRELKPIFSLQNGHLIIASIWNIKHSLELIIKALGITLDENYLTHHNLQNLLNDLDMKINSLCIQKDLCVLKNLVNKYYQCDFSSKTKFLDTKNTLFKYPEADNNFSKVKISLDYTFVHDLRRKDIDQFLRDIHSIREIYYRIESSVLYQKP